MCPSSSFAQRERIAGRRMAKGGVVRAADGYYPDAPEEENFDASLGMIRPPSNLDPAGVTHMPEAAVQQAISAPSAMPAPGRLPHEQLQDKEAEWLLNNKQPNPAWWRTLAGAGTQFLLGHRSPAAGAALSGLITDSDPKVREYQTHVKNLGILNPIAKGEREDVTAQARWNSADAARQRALGIADRDAATRARQVQVDQEKADNDQGQRYNEAQREGFTPAAMNPLPGESVPTPVAATPGLAGSPLDVATTDRSIAGPPRPVPVPGKAMENYKVGGKTVYGTRKTPAELEFEKESAKVKANPKLAAPAAVPADQRIFKTAAVIVAKKHGLTLDPAQDPYDQLPPEVQAEAAALRKQMEALPPSELDKAIKEQRLASMQDREGSAATTRSDKSYKDTTRSLDAIAKPVDDAIMRMGRLQQTLAQGSPQADALVAPELLTVMAGGAGSGLRMNEAEIARIVGGRSKWESLRAAAQQWSLDPEKANSITADQRRQIRALVTEVHKKLLDKKSALNKAYEDISNSDDVGVHRKTLLNTRKAISDIDMAAAGGAGKINVTDPTGNVHQFDTQQQADTFKKLAGIQ